MKKNFFIKRTACFVLLSVCGIVGAYAQSFVLRIPINKVVDPTPPIVIPYSLEESLSFEVYQTNEELLLSASTDVCNVRVVIKNDCNVVSDETIAIMADENTSIDISSLTSGTYVIKIYYEEEEWQGWFNV